MANLHAAAFDALGDPTRRHILEKLGRGPLPVGKLAAGLGLGFKAAAEAEQWRDGR